jgi:Fur family peroxide stress response transcriptional regulator
MSSHDGQQQVFLKRGQELKDKCREAGLRLTHQRLEIFHELLSATDHPAVEAIHKRVRVRIPTISLDTTYRTISTFEHYGLVSKVCVFEDKARFCGDSSAHHHLFYTKCKSISDFFWDSFDELENPAETGA